MSKQLTLSATVAVLSMAAFAVVASLAVPASDSGEHGAGNAPLVSLSATR